MTAHLDDGRRYVEGVWDILDQVVEHEAEALDRAGGIMCLFGTGHSHLLAAEGHSCACGLALVAPIVKHRRAY
ncbi:SIS domain-containing protein [Aggregatilinea lenta]|uniref:SIS domain-containing protein n=1 Tax=Aggregatilinea lenta TaxID=913108 RepID=UPI000E5B6C11|nr:SIS domain-containing protein [Aggregatilinea lenta]